MCVCVIHIFYLYTHDIQTSSTSSPFIVYPSNNLPEYVDYDCVADVFLEYEMKRDKSSSKSKAVIKSVNIGSLELTQTDDVYQSPESQISTFSCCYSDTESEEEDDDDRYNMLCSLD